MKAHQYGVILDARHQGANMRERRTEDYRQHYTLDMFGHYERLAGLYPHLHLEMRALTAGGFRIGFVADARFQDGIEAAENGFMAYIDALIMQCLNKVDSPITAAAQLVDVDLAFAHVQDHALIRSGDMAGIFAAGDWGVDRTDIDHYWRSLTSEQRRSLLLTYLTFESWHLDGEERLRCRRADARGKGMTKEIAHELV
ncbi:hypothetical protein FX016_22970 [Cupriavidus gilardii]|nr:hypothetical protein FX016_22970 [Cupriavidus gilardii]